jgi:hypothetical protein
MCDPSIPSHADSLVCSLTGYCFMEPAEYYWKTSCYHCNKTFCLDHILDYSGYDSTAVICLQCAKTICPAHRVPKCNIDHVHDIICSYDRLCYRDVDNDFSNCIHCNQKSMYVDALSCKK